MRTLIGSIGFAVLAALAVPAAAQTGAAVAAKGPGVAGAVQTVKLTGDDHRDRRGHARGHAEGPQAAGRSR